MNRMEHIQVGEVKLSPEVLEPKDKKVFNIYVDFRGKRFKQGSVIAMYTRKKTPEEVKASELAVKKVIEEKRANWSRRGKSLGVSEIQEGESYRKYVKRLSQARKVHTEETNKRRKLDSEKRRKERAEQRLEEQKKKVEERIKMYERKVKALSQNI